MKNSQNNQFLGVIALFSASFIGGFAPLASKILLRELPPVTILFLRLSIMIAILFPISTRFISHLVLHGRKLLVLSLLWVGNLICFIIGIKYTTAIMSGLLYATAPILVVMGNYLFHRIKITKLQAVGISLGFMGVITIISRLFVPSQGFGTFSGNLLLVLGVSSYALFLLYSKHLSFHISPLELTTSIASIGWVIAGLTMAFTDGFGGLQRLPFLSVHAWTALIFVGTGLGVVMYFLNQWGIKHGTALAASISLYIGTLTTTITGILFLSEKLTPFIVIGGALLLVGVYISTVIPLQIHRRSTIR